jgi:phospholipid N-methyltransferase
VPGFIGDMRNTMCNDYQWKAVGTLTDALRQGEALEELPSSEALRIMESNAASQMHAAAVLEAAISPWLSRRKTLYVLTLGCGNGVLGFSLVKKRKNSKVWSMDYPGVISIAKKFANEMQIPNELVEFIEVNNLAEATFTSNMPYDLIIVGQNMFNTLGSTKAAAILQQASEALKTNGRLVLYETLSGNEEESPYAALTSLTMFATRKKGKVHPLSWFNDLLSTTGFVEAVVNDLLPFPEKLLITYKNIIAKGQVKKKQN